jgi:3-hydroxybutyryl-CoA dehydratase
VAEQSVKQATWDAKRMLISAVENGLKFEDLAIGMSAESIHEVSESDVIAFAELSGDRNPLHLDEAFAARTPFKERIAHGMLTAAYVSALIGAKLPGPGSIYVSQTLKFRRPVRLGAQVTTRVEVCALDPQSGRVTLDCRSSVDGKIVLEGQAVILAPRNGDQTV